MKKVYLALGVLAAAMMFTGCVTGKDIERLETKMNTQTGEMRDMRQELDEVRLAVKDQAKSARAMTAQLDEISNGMAGVREDLETVKRNQANIGNTVFTMSGGGGETLGGGRVDELSHEIQDTKLKLDAFKAALLQKLADIEYAVSGGASGGPSGESGQPAGTGGSDAAQPDPLNSMTLMGDEAPKTEPDMPPPVDDPQILYNAAYLDYSKGDYELALMGFKDYLASFPDGELAGNSQYWIGESLYSMGHYSQALIEFEKVVSDYPSSPKVPAAILKKGLCFEKLGRTEDATASYREVVQKYPGTEPAGIADQKLNPPVRGVVEGR